MNREIHARICGSVGVKFPCATRLTTLKNETLKDNIVSDLVCHCFGYSVDDIEKDYQDNSNSTIMEKIQTEKKFGNCQCGIKNPKGK